MLSTKHAGRTYDRTKQTKQLKATVGSGCESSIFNEDLRSHHWRETYNYTVYRSDARILLLLPLCYENSSGAWNTDTGAIRSRTGDYSCAYDVSLHISSMVGVHREGDPERMENFIGLLKVKWSGFSFAYDVLISSMVELVGTQGEVIWRAWRSL